jgi:hypothetical protein
MPYLYKNIQSAFFIQPTCSKKADVENEDVVEMDTKSDKYSDDENNDVGVIMLFQVISYKALKPKKSSAMLAHLASNYLLIVPIV